MLLGVSGLLLSLLLLLARVTSLLLSLLLSHPGPISAERTLGCKGLLGLPGSEDGSLPLHLADAEVRVPAHAGRLHHLAAGGKREALLVVVAAATAGRRASPLLLRVLLIRLPLYLDGALLQQPAGGGSQVWGVWGFGGFVAAGGWRPAGGGGGGYWVRPGQVLSVCRVCRVGARGGKCVWGAGQL